MLSRRVVPGVVLLLALIVLQACGGGTDAGRVLILGLDGMDPQAVDLLMSEGKLPNFAKLRQEGAYGPLRSQKPLLSPVVWTTVATGRTPDKHRIGHFVAINQATGEPLPVTSQMRKVKALWNILSDAGRRVATVGWWATWPAETVNGAIVSDHLCYHFLFQDGFEEEPSETLANTFPPGLESEIAGFVKRPGDITPEEAAPYVRVSAEEFARPFEFTDELGHFKWALATAESYRRIGLHLWETESPDLMMVYVEGTDSTSHLFGHLFRTTGLSGELAEQEARYGNTVEQMYIYADRLIGEFLEVMDDRTTLIVLSDHGFKLGKLHEDPSKTRDLRRISEKYHNMDGILYMYGNRVKAGVRLTGATILDVAPTVLALSGVPAAENMPGRVLSDAVEIEPLPRIASYEDGGGGGVEVARTDPSVDPQIMKKLQSLGYLGATSPTGNRNLAAVMFENGQYEEAVMEYEKLVRENPDDGSIRTSMAGALGALGRYDEAMAQLEEALRVQPLNPEAYHNRAVLFEREKDPESAIRDYRTALRYNPQYEPSRTALARLGVTGDPLQPDSDAERRAFGLAQQASDAARHGNYEEAMRRIDEAQQIAPDYALVYQYRSNVAYLMGDRDAAIAALRKGLELEPDNALFGENLKQLLAEPSPSP